MTESRWFEIAITIIILINSLLIGVETYTLDPTIKLVQKLILGLFTFEIVARFIAADSIKGFSRRDGIYLTFPCDCRIYS